MVFSWIPPPDLEYRIWGRIRQWLAFAVVGMAIHNIAAHGLDQWSVVLALGALQIHPTLSFFPSDPKPPDSARIEQKEKTGQ